MDGRELTEASILLDESGVPWTELPGVRDVTVFHPRSVYELGRPTWLRLGGQRKPFVLPAEVGGDEPRCIVEARSAKEGEEAIPVDRIELVAGEPVPVLLLPVGDFVIEARSASDERLWSAEARIR